MLLFQLVPWMQNYSQYPWMMAAPLVGLAMAVLTILAARFDRAGFAFLFSSLMIAGVILTGGLLNVPPSCHLA